MPKQDKTRQQIDVYKGEYSKYWKAQIEDVKAKKNLSDNISSKNHSEFRKKADKTTKLLKKLEKNTIRLRTEIQEDNFTALDKSEIDVIRLEAQREIKNLRNENLTAKETQEYKTALSNINSLPKSDEKLNDFHIARTFYAYCTEDLKIRPESPNIEKKLTKLMSELGSSKKEDAFIKKMQEKFEKKFPNRIGLVDVRKNLQSNFSTLAEKYRVGYAGEEISKNWEKNREDEVEKAKANNSTLRVTEFIHKRLDDNIDAANKIGQESNFSNIRQNTQEQITKSNEQETKYLHSEKMIGTIEEEIVKRPLEKEVIIQDSNLQNREIKENTEKIVERKSAPKMLPEGVEQYTQAASAPAELLAEPQQETIKSLITSGAEIFQEAKITFSPRMQRAEITASKVPPPIQPEEPEKLRASTSLENSSFGVEVPNTARASQEFKEISYEKKRDFIDLDVQNSFYHAVQEKYPDFTRENTAQILSQLSTLAENINDKYFDSMGNKSMTGYVSELELKDGQSASDRIENIINKSTDDTKLDRLYQAYQTGLVDEMLTNAFSQHVLNKVKYADSGRFSENIFEMKKEAITAVLKDSPNISQNILKSTQTQRIIENFANNYFGKSTKQQEQALKDLGQDIKREARRSADITTVFADQFDTRLAQTFSIDTLGNDKKEILSKIFQQHNVKDMDHAKKVCADIEKKIKNTDNIKSKTEFLKNILSDLKNENKQERLSKRASEVSVPTGDDVKRESTELTNSETEKSANIKARLDVPYTINASESKDSDSISFIKPDAMMEKKQEGREFREMHRTIDKKTNTTSITYYHPDEGKWMKPEYQVTYVYRENQDKTRVLIGIKAGERAECENPLIHITNDKGHKLPQQADTYFEKGEFKVRRTQALHNIMEGTEDKLELEKLCVTVDEKPVDVKKHFNDRGMPEAQLVVMHIALERNDDERASVTFNTPIKQTAPVQEKSENKNLEAVKPEVKKQNVMQKAFSAIRGVFTSNKEKMDQSKNNISKQPANSTSATAKKPTTIRPSSSPRHSHNQGQERE